MTYLPLSFIAAFFIYQVIENKQSFSKWIKAGFIFLGGVFTILLVLAPILFYNKNFLASFIKDEFAKDSLTINMGWTGWEFLVGLLYPLGIVLSIWLYKKQRRLASITILSCFAGITLFGYAIFVVPKIERFSQGPAIDFFESLQGKNVYITTIGHKSYAHYFYAQMMPSKESDEISTIKRNYKNSLSDPKDFNANELKNKTNNWLLDGAIDKNAYFVTKSTHALDLNKYKDIKMIERKGGFILYKRTQLK